MTSSEKSNGNLASRIGAICFWLAVWAALAAFVGNDIVLAGPFATLKALGEMLVTKDFWLAVALSGSRIVVSSIASALCGIALGLIASRVRAIRILLDVPIQIMKSAPVACVVVVLLVAFGSVGAIVIIVAFVALPPFYVASLETAQMELDDEARVLELMGLSRRAIFFAYTWPKILPIYKHAAKTAVALSWRAGITGELLSVPMGSMGAAVYASKLTLDTPALLGWTAVVMLLAFVCELATLGILDLTASSPKLALRMHRHSEGTAVESSAALQTDAVLELDSVSKSYGEGPVLDEVSFRLSPRERICLMAPTGTGKTTLVRIALGIEEADGGNIARPALCGVVLQQPTLIESLSAWENVVMVADRGRDRSNMRIQLEKLLPEGAASRRADQLSGGTRRLTEIARALFSAGECIVLDEPFAGLDPVSKERACTFVLENLGERPLVAATHEATDAGLLGAQIAEL